MLPALRRVLTVVPIQHANPKVLVGEIAQRLASQHENHLANVAAWLIENRKKIVSVKCVHEALAAVKTPMITVRPGDPSFAAWMTHYTGMPAVQSYGRSHGFAVHGIWPPGWAAKQARDAA